MTIKKNDIMEKLKQPAPEIESNLFNKGKFKIIIIYQDLSIKTYRRNLKNPYYFTVGERDYLISSKCIIRDKNPTLMYYFNNPFPIKFEHSPSSMTSQKIMEKLKESRDEDDIDIKKNWKEIQTTINYDASTLHTLNTTNVINKMYNDGGKTMGDWMILIGGIAIAVLVILQVTGQIDIMTYISGTGG